MRYVIIDEPSGTNTGDIYTQEYSNKAEAIKQAVYDWEHLTPRERAKRYICVIESVNPDETAIDHLDGDLIYKCY